MSVVGCVRDLYGCSLTCLKLWLDLEVKTMVGCEMRLRGEVLEQCLAFWSIGEEHLSYL